MVLGSPYTAPLMYPPIHCKPTATPAALGIDTVLTSGAAASCVQGVDVLCSLLAERDRTNGPESN